jgi:hypothetical protein
VGSTDVTDHRLLASKPAILLPFPARMNPFLIRNRRSRLSGGFGFRLSLLGLRARLSQSLHEEVGNTHGPRAEKLEPSAYFLNRSPSACFITCPPTSAIDFVSGMSFGQISTQFCA